ncbi:MAG TPA: efflux RND transporter periplasmic adaptor subunit [Syntrophales bacterium]|nr:efflux RND transporter periplasmic adaptor subunit [Syntrophales bacterium]
MMRVSFFIHNKVFQHLVAASVFLLLIFSAVGCRREAADAGDSHTEIVKSPDPSVIEIDHPERFPLVEAEGRKVADEINVCGVVTPDINRSVAVLSLGGGRVVDIKVRLGDDVKKGQVLLQIHSPELAAAFSDLQKAKADEMLSHKQLERLRKLVADGAASTKDLEAAQNGADKAGVDLKTAADHIRVLGGDPDRITSVIDIRAPISGTIVEQNVTTGGGVRSIDATPNLFTIADLSRVWVLCDLYEDTISRVRIGDTAKIHLNSYPDRTFQGRVSNIGRVLEPATRSAKVRIELDNPNLLMRSGMFVTAVIRSQRSVERPVLPATAIVRLHDKNWVFQPMDGNHGGRFQKIEVQTGPMVSDTLQQIISGIKIHDKVVAYALQFSSAAEGK